MTTNNQITEDIFGHESEEYKIGEIYSSIDEQIAHLELEKDNCNHCDDLQNRIKYLKERKATGDIWIDIESLQDSIENICTYTDSEVRAIEN
jgi:hypothetical protein